nr:hypothetical protein [Pseudomonas syringae]
MLADRCPEHVFWLGPRVLDHGRHPGGQRGRRGL